MAKSKEVATANTKLPTIKETFFDQTKQQPWKITDVLTSAIVVTRKDERRIFKFHEIEWDENCEWWRFKMPEKKTKVYLENIPAGSNNVQGTWEEVVSIPLSQDAAKAIEIILKSEYPEIDFAASSGKPSSYFL